MILAVPTVGPDGMLRTPTVPECYPLAECLRRLPEGAMVLGGTLPPDCRKIVEERHLAYTDLLALPELQELNAIATAEGRWRWPCGSRTRPYLIRGAWCWAMDAAAAHCAADWRHWAPR